MGDFNYRINGVAGAIMTAMENNMYEVLQFNDQLFIEKKINRLPEQMREGVVEFAPTYKLLPNRDVYFLKKRVPGWTDRIFYFSPKGTLTQKSYDSNNTIKFSDHRPVFAQFEWKF